MQGKFSLGFVALSIIGGALSLFLLTSLNPSQAKEGGWEGLKTNIKKTKELHDLKLAPAKEAAVLALEQKYAKERQDLMSALRKYREELEGALAAAPPDEAKIQDLVQAANATQDKLLTSLKMERDEAMALMTPFQQGQFLLVLGNWLGKVQL
ncbi:MAG: periplasmic heavy metal sensor [Desulfobaccales bacterium]